MSPKMQKVSEHKKKEIFIFFLRYLAHFNLCQETTTRKKTNSEKEVKIYPIWMETGNKSC